MMSERDTETLRSVIAGGLGLCGLDDADMQPLLDYGIKAAAQVGSMAMDDARGTLPAAELEALKEKAAALIKSNDRETVETAWAVMLFLWAGEQEE